MLVVELVEARVDPDRERVRAQQPAAEAVDGRDPRAVELAGEVGPPALEQRGADARAELAGRLARVGDDEHRLDVEPLVADGADEALDEHRGLAGAGAGRDEHLAAASTAASAARSLRRAHPAHRPEVAPGRALAALRIVRDVAGADPLRAPSPCSRAVSTCAQNSSSSR